MRTPLPNPPPTETPPSYPALQMNWQDFLPLMEDDDIPEDQKRAFIEALWSIVIAFVDLGWNVAPAKEICGQNFDLTAALRAAMLNSNDIIHEDREEA